MTGAMGAPNPVCGNREPLQSQPEDGEVEGGGQKASGGRGNEGGWEGARGTANLYSPSLHVSLCFTAFVGEKKPAEPPSSLYYCRGISEGSTSFFFCIQSVHRTKKGMAVNSSANELTNLGGFSSVVDLSHTSKCFISFMS